MRTLGYPRLISVRAVPGWRCRELKVVRCYVQVENFRTPNFALVADVLFWLVHKCGPCRRHCHARCTAHALPPWRRGAGMTPMPE